MSIFAQQFSTLYKKNTKELKTLQKQNIKSETMEIFENNKSTIRYADYSAWNRNNFNQNIKNFKCLELAERLKQLPIGGTSIIHDKKFNNHKRKVGNSIETIFVEAPNDIQGKTFINNIYINVVS